jgi:hypothetical protein
MVSYGRAILFGFLIWLIVFVVAIAIAPIRENWRALFESIMPVVLALATVVFGLSYFRRVRSAFVREAMLLGLLWYVISVVIDLPLMLTGPMQMTLVEYAADIGLTYVIIPVITIGIGLARAQAVAAGGAGVA